MNAKAVFQMYDDYMAEVEAERAKQLQEQKEREQENDNSQYSPEPKEIEKKVEVKPKDVNLQSNLPDGKSDASDNDGGSTS